MALFILVCALPLNSLHAQIKPGVKQSALRYSEIASPSDIFSSYYNPAAGALFPKTQIATYYSPSPYGLSELRQFGVHGNYPGPELSMSIGVYNYGFKFYNETHTLVNFSFSPYKNIYAGVNLVGQNLQIDRYGNSFALRIDAGAILTITNDINIALTATNFNSAKYSGSENSIPRIFRTGVSVSPYDKVMLYAEVESETNFEPDLKFGVSLNPHKILTLNTGYSRLSGELSLGGSISYLGICLDYGFTYHKILGSVNVLGITIPDVTEIF